MTALEALTAIHSGEGAAVAFARMAGGWQECGALLIADLPAKWPSVAPYLARDSYFGLASTYAQKRVTRLSVLGLPLWCRRTERLRWINCVAVDLDRHAEKNFSVERLLNDFWCGLVLQHIPLPTFLSFSGRGMWALWQVADHKNLSQPVPAFSDRCNLAQRINHALVKKFASLGADPTATDSARVMRLPGSANSKAAPENAQVQFFRASNAAYTLPELADVLGIAAHKVFLPGETRTKNAKKQAAAALRWRYPLDGFLALWRIRGKFSQGTRRPAVWVYAVLLLRNRTTPERILIECLRLAEGFSPPLSIADVKRVISASENAAHYNVSNAKFALMLKITAEELANLPQWFRPKTSKGKLTRIAGRRAAIANELRAANGERVSTRRLAKLLREKHGISVSQSTMVREIRAFAESFPVVIDPRASLCISSKTNSLLKEAISSGAKLDRAPKTRCSTPIIGTESKFARVNRKNLSPPCPFVRPEGKG